MTISPSHPLALRALVERAAVAGDLLAEPQRVRELPARCLSSALAPRGQRQAAHVLGAVAQQVEGDERRRLRAVERVDVVVALDVDAPLQPLEPGRPAARVERDDLAVEEQRRPQRARQRLERPDDGGELRGLLVAEPGPEPDVGPRLAGRDMDQRPDAVVLRLEDQRLAGRAAARASVASIGRTVGGILAPGGHRSILRDRQIPNPKLQIPTHSQRPIPKLSQGPNPRTPKADSDRELPWQLSWDLALEVRWDLEVGLGS